MDDDKRITTFLSQRCTVYIKLRKLQEKVWQDPRADKYFKNQRDNSDAATPELKKIFWKIMLRIAKEMDEVTRFATDIKVRRQNEHCAPPPKLLDLCMAPGGFSNHVRHSLGRSTEISGITLPMSLGGHELLLDRSKKLTVEFLDVTMLAAEMGLKTSDITLDHPDHDLFNFDRPFVDQSFDLILCDGQVLRTHKRQRYREELEPSRLTVSQLIFALQHIKPGGTFVMLLHKPELMSTFKIICAFHEFSTNVQLFKPSRYHLIRSSFYLVAKGVNPECDAALGAVDEWKEAWASSTLRFSIPSTSDAEVQSLLDKFGLRFIEICEPIWKVQLEALSKKFRYLI